MTGPRRGRFRMAVTAVALAATCQNAMAGNILRRAGNGAPASPETAAAQVAAQAAAANAQADVLARQAQSPLRKALEAIKQYQVTQDAARAAANALPGKVPNGLAPGGLEVAPATAPQGADVPMQAVQGDRTAVTVKQTEATAILTWNTFNVGKETDLHFDQTAGGASASSWIALNRVIDPSASPSVILGNIRAEGQVYILNRNGILFGGSSQVNVGTLLASTLDIYGGDARFREGLLFKPGITLQADPAGSGAVTVEAGAKIAVAPFGQAALFGSQVVNRGSIEAPDGQVLLAAGSAISLAKAIDTTENPGAANRGYAPPGVAGHGNVENAGMISTPRGNITLVASETVQNGLLAATTNGEANGTIILGADGFTTKLAEGSLTQVLPDEGGKKVLGGGLLAPSRINVYGEKISVLDGAAIYAPSGEVMLSARLASGTVDDTRVYLGEGSRIDVSGLRDVEIAMEKNTIEAQLRASELRDNPVLRDSTGVRGRTFYFDARLGTKVADVSGYYGLVERDVKEVMTTGGHVTLLGNEIITRAGSVIDISGGSLRFLDGYVRSSQLIDPTGKLVRVEDAVPGIRYAGIEGDFVADHARWGVAETYSSSLVHTRLRFEKGYEQGSSAGKLTLSTNEVPYTDPGGFTADKSATGASRILDGSLVAGTIVGPKQREMPTPGGDTDPTRAWREHPANGSLELKKSGDVVIGDTPEQLGPGFRFDTPIDPSLKAYEHLIPARWFDGRTIGNLAIDSGFTTDVSVPDHPQGTANLAPGGHLTIGTGVVVNLGDGGSFTFSGKRADLDGTVLAPGGAATFTALDSGGDATVRLGATGTIDVAGRWTNDHLDGPSQPVHSRDGGAVKLTGRDVILEKGSLVDVAGGAKLDVTGTKLVAGDGGSIGIEITRPTRPDENPAREAGNGRLELSGTLSGYALGKGGAVVIDTPYDIVIGAGLPASAGASSRLFRPSFFTEGGFSSFTILGERGVTVSQGTVLAPSVQSLVLPVQFAGLASGARLDDVGSRQVLPPDRAQPMSLTLSTVPVRSIPAGDFRPLSYSRSVTLELGARIEMDPGSAVRLASSGTLDVNGTVQAPGGAVELVATDPYALQDAKVRVGSDAQILVAGYQKSTPDGALFRRSVEGGGRIAVSAAGSGGTVTIDPGAVLDASGIHGVADLPAAPGDAPSGSSRYQPVAVDGNAGSVSVTAQVGELRGTYRLAPGGETGAGGSFTISASSPVVVREKDGPAAPGIVTVLAAAINGSDADSVTLSALPRGTSNVGDSMQILFDGDVTLHARRSLTLAAPVIGTTPGDAPSNVTLESAYVQFVGGPATQVPDFGKATLQGVLDVHAGVIDLGNWISLGCLSSGCSAGGFGTARFRADGDIRLFDSNGVSGAGRISSGLFSGGALQFDAAQVYVASLAQVTRSDGLARAASDPGFLVQSDLSIRITSNGAAAPVPLSFGERVTLRAPDIEQGGVLRAPQGQIQMQATGPDGSVTLLPGSVTSASLEGLVVPFGSVTSVGSFLGYDKPGQGPTKSVLLDAPNVKIARGSIIDVSGGGDLLGWVFVPGNGGSRDILTSSGGFAILPSLGSGPAPLGGVATLQDPRLNVGDTVWLDGMLGLKAGYYTLLPAHYALLPGGLLIQPLGGSLSDVPAGANRADGSVVVGGYRAVAGTPVRDPGIARFLVMTQDVFKKYSQLALHSFDDQARALAAEAGLIARTPYDGGTSVLSTTGSLTLEGSGRFGAPEGGLLGNLDISAPRIAVVGSGAAAPDPTYLTIDKQALEAFGAGSVLLGGTRASTPAGTAVTVTATDVTVDIGSASPWTGPEIVLASTGRVTVADGSVIRGSGAVSNDTNPLQLSGDGALLRLSTGNRVAITRQGATGAGGELHVGTADLSAAGSLTLEGSRNIALSPSAALSGRQFDIASLRLNLGDAPSDAPGTTLGATTVDRLASSADLLLRGYDSIHLYGNLQLGGRVGAGSATLEKITLDTGRVQGHSEPKAAAKITASELTLRNSGGAPSGDPAGSVGALELDVDRLRLGPGAVQVSGYESLRGRAGTVEAAGKGSLDFGGSLSLATGRIQAVSGARYEFHVGEDATFTGDPGGSLPAPSESLGGSVAIDASSIRLDTAVLLPAGSFGATARSGSLLLGSGASVDVSGRAVDLQDQVQLTQGGTITLAAHGDLEISPGAVLDVSGSSRGGAAGTVDLASGGLATIGSLGSPASASPLRGGAEKGYAGGAFFLDSGKAGQFSDLNEKLESAGFDRTRSIRLRDQDVVLGAGEAIHAHDVVLRSDGGRVVVAGEIHASGSVAHPDGGRIDLVGGGGVFVEGTSRIEARAGDTPAGGFDPSSGSLEIVALGGRADLAPGASIDVGGGRQGGGSVVVRAGREGSDVAVDRVAAGIHGAREVLVQGVKEYQAAVVDAPLVQTMLGDAGAWLLASQDAVRKRLGASASPGVDLQVAPGILVRSDGNLSIQSDIAINGALGHGYLGLVAPGQIDVRATVSDGFATAARGAPLLTGRSSSYAFESGGDLLLAANSMIRTGTGGISLQVGRDLVLSPPSSTTDSAPVVYTAGRNTDPRIGWKAADGFQGEFPTDGGDIDVRAFRDILSPLTTQSTSAWLFRQGETDWRGTAASSAVGNQQAAWSIVFKNFEQGMGALGGGDVHVAAGRDVVQLQAAIPTTGHLATPTGQTPQPGDLEIRGGGNLDLEAGRDVAGGLFVLGRGEAHVRAGGAVLAGRAVGLRAAWNSQELGPPRPIGVLFGLMDATASVSAASSVLVEGVFDPARQGQIVENLPGRKGSAFSGYSERSALDVISLAGSVTYANDPWASVDLTRQFGAKAAYQVLMSGSGEKSLNDVFGRSPATLHLASLESSVSLSDGSGGVQLASVLQLAPSSTGNLELLARKDVRIGIDVNMEGTAAEYRRGPLFPFATNSTVSADLGVELPAESTNSRLGSVPIHAGDTAPARIVALDGSVCAYRPGLCVPGSFQARIALPKPLEVAAGTDVKGGTYASQNNAVDDVSWIRAGRDIDSVKLQVSGVGTAGMEAGRDVILRQPPQGGSILGTGGGIEPNRNQALPAGKGVDLYVIAGTAGGVTYDAFAAAYLDPANGKGVVRTYLPELAAYLKGLGKDPGPDGDLGAAFRSLPREQQVAFLDRVFFVELKETGIDYNDASGSRYHSYERGFQAITILFPSTPSAVPEGKRGSIILEGRPFETWARGDITVLAPYGGVAVGSELVDTGEKGGIVTRRGGDIRIMADQNIDLFTSRVFTLQGGDVTMWTSNGSITAGAGSRTSVFQRPLAYAMSNDAVVTLDAFGISTGAGIGVLDALPGNDRPKSRLDLIAPNGEVNAGDAGIRVFGDLNIAALTVVGLENISVTGASAGVPKVEAPNIGALTSGAQLAQAAAKETSGADGQVARRTVADLPSLITVEPVGYEVRDSDDDEEGPRKK